MAKGTGKDPGSLEVKVFAGAVIGAVLAGASPTVSFRHDMDAALALPEKGLPL